MANRIVEITPGGIIDRVMGFDEYLESGEVARIRDELCHGHQELNLQAVFIRKLRMKTDYLPRGERPEQSDVRK